jgi:cephalosporin hydroxylase
MASIRQWSRRGTSLLAAVGRRPRPETTIADFHRLYYDSHVWRGRTRWLGVETQKCPLDLWAYQEILVSRRPDVLVETGTFNGGSALYLATLCDVLDHGTVVSVDIEDRPGRPRHPRITYVAGQSSTSASALSRVAELIGPGDSVMVLLDSDHSRDHVLEELRLYAPLVTSGQYLVVEDTNVNGHPVLPEHGAGPMEALDAFLAESRDFVHDPSPEKFLLTFNPRGYLRRR